MTLRHASSTSPRRAFTMIEITVSVILLAIAMTLTLEVLGWVARQRRLNERRQCALQEAANVMERLAARPWDRLAPGDLGPFALSAAASRTLPEAELRVAVHPEPGELDARRLTVLVSWRGPSGRSEAPVRLTSWVYLRRGQP